jgi:hypothetical protein
MAVTGEACSNCRFWLSHEEPGPDADGECRRYAPRPGSTKMSWPRTKEADWCGEYEPRRHKARAGGPAVAGA